MVYNFIRDLRFGVDWFFQSIDSKDKHPSSGSFFSNFSNIVSKVATDATHVIKDKVGTSLPSAMISEFNKEQEEFIKSKGTEQ